MAGNDKAQLFERTPVPKAVLTLAIPTVLSSLVMVIYNLADTYFVGMLNNPFENAGVTLAAPVLLAFNAVNNLFGVGSSSMMSRALGVKDYETVRRSSAFGFYCALLSGLLFSLMYMMFQDPLLQVLGTAEDTVRPTAEYLKWTVSFGAAPSILNVVLAYLVRAEGASLHASIGTMSGCVLNMILDPVFILPWGLDMGAAGAGLATCVSNCFACLYFFVLLAVKRGNTYVCVKPSAFKPTREIVKGVCGVGIPASIQNLLNVTGMTVLNNAVSAFGSEAVAAMGIAQKVTMIPWEVSLGFSQGVMPLVGYNYSARNGKRMKDAVLYTAKLMMIIMGVSTVLFLLFAPQLIGAFMNNAVIVEYGAAFMRGLCLAQPFLAMDFLALGVFQACGMGRWSLLFAFLRKIVLEIPAMLLLNSLFPMYGLAYAQLCAEVILATAAVLFLRRIFQSVSGRTGASET